MISDASEILSEEGALSVNVEDIPEIISTSIENISKLEVQVRSAEQSANNAMDFVSSQMTRYEEKGAWLFKRRSGNTKDIIEDTQEAVENLANAQQVSVSALTMSFEFQKKLAETARYLFQLGCANVAINRIAVRAIELKLSGASKSKLSELARQEMISVVKQLKEQEDILKKQELLNMRVKEHDSRLAAKDVVDIEQTEKIELLNSEHKISQEKIVEMTKALSIKNHVDAEQDHQIKEIVLSLKNIGFLYDKQENLISNCSSIIDSHAELITNLTSRIQHLESFREEQVKEIQFLKTMHQKIFYKIYLSIASSVIFLIILAMIIHFFKLA